MTAAEVKALAKAESDRRLKMRYLAIYHFLSGSNRTQIAQYLGVARGSVNTWVTLFLSSGINGLRIKPSSGRPTELAPEQLKDLTSFIKKNAVKPTGGRLIAEDVKNHISCEYGVTYSLSNTYRLLHALGFSWITSRSKHPKQSNEVQEAFKKLPTGNDLSHPVQCKA